MKQRFSVTDKTVFRAVVSRLTDLGKSFELVQAWDFGGTSTVFTNDPDESFLSKLVEECKDGAVHFDVDDKSARGRVTLVPSGYGPNLLVDGQLFGYVDLYERSLDKFPEDTRSPQILFFTDVDDDEPLAKVFVDKGRMTVIIHKDAVSLVDHVRALHTEGDYIYQWPSDVEEAAGVEDGASTKRAG